MKQERGQRCLTNTNHCWQLFALIKRCSFAVLPKKGCVQRSRTPEVEIYLIRKSVSGWKLKVGCNPCAMTLFIFTLHIITKHVTLHRLENCAKRNNNNKQDWVIPFLSRAQPIQNMVAFLICSTLDDDSKSNKYVRPPSSRNKSFMSSTRSRTELILY